DDVAVAVVDDVGRAVFLRQRNTVWTGTDGEQSGCAADSSAGNRHQTDRTDTDDTDGVTELHICQLNTVQTGRHHIAEHDCCRWVQTVRQFCQVSVGLVDVEQLPEHTVFKVGELPSCQHSARV